MSLPDSGPGTEPFRAWVGRDFAKIPVRNRRGGGNFLPKIIRNRKRRPPFMDFARFFTGVLKNDRKEFDALVNRCHRQAYNIAYRMTGNHADAEDLTQESFLRAYRFFDRYNREMPFENWLYR